MKTNKKHIINPEQFGYMKMKSDDAINIRYVDYIGNEHTLACLYDDLSYILYSQRLITYVGKYGVMGNTRPY